MCNEDRARRYHARRVKERVNDRRSNRESLEFRSTERVRYTRLNREGQLHRSAKGKCHLHRDTRRRMSLRDRSNDTHALKRVDERNREKPRFYGKFTKFYPSGCCCLFSFSSRVLNSRYAARNALLDISACNEHVPLC